MVQLNMLSIVYGLVYYKYFVLECEALKTLSLMVKLGFPEITSFT